MSSTKQTDSNCSSVIDFLHRECGLCSYCASSSVIIADDGHDNKMSSSSSPSSCDKNSDDDGNIYYCTVCLGLSSPSYHERYILPIIDESLLPYFHGNGGNNFTRESPTVNLPWVIALRAHCAIVGAKSFLASEEAKEQSTRLGKLRTAEEIYLCIKERLRSSLRSLISEKFSSASNVGNLKMVAAAAAAEDDKLILRLQKEEAGYLGVHLLILSPDVNDIEQIIPPSLKVHIQQHKEQILQSYNRILNPRKRFRGNDPTLKQGGDPRNNLELRVRRSRRGIANIEKGEMVAAKQSIDEWNMIVSWLDKKFVLQWIENMESDSHHNSELADWLRQLHQECSQIQQKTQQCSIYAASWRRPFYVQGTYTKSLRVISQTPFYVPATKNQLACGNNGDGDTSTNKSHNAMVRKGISSVEEEICPVLAIIGCGGISQQNNEQDPIATTSKNGKQQQKLDGGRGATVYGMCKFHASGREDMDVRMLLPPPSVAEAGAKSNTVITGRPFVCEVFDAHRIPSESDLANVVDTINCQEGKMEIVNRNVACGENVAKELEMDEKGWLTLVQQHRYHGNNPRGVGVTRPLSLVPSSAFSNLQSETEDKVKYYGMVCWSSLPIASDEELMQTLKCLPWNNEGEEGGKRVSNSYIYPLELQQHTPLRVLHRRSSDIRTRYILSLSACRIEDHWFRLRMSTSAGTYVKEFVHGDCGRTYPSIASLLGGRTDITELDCEGIAV